MWQAIYTAGIGLPRPVARCQYWHRALNPQKLIAIGFSRIPPQFEKMRRPMDTTKRHYQLPEKTVTPGIRRMEPKDVPEVTQLLNTYLAKFALAPVFAEDDVTHWILGRSGVMESFVVEKEKEKGKEKEKEKEKEGHVTDLISFYALPSTIIGHQKYDLLRAAYCYYNVATSVPLEQLMTDALILAKSLGYDVFNTLDALDNKTFLQSLKFGIGDGFLQYYLYNWRTSDIQSEQLGLVML